MTLAALLSELIAASGGTQRDFARAVGITPSTLSHLLSGDPHYGLGIVPCLRIAGVTKSSASHLLHAAGKADVAALIEQSYGSAAQEQRISDARRNLLTPGDLRLIARLRRLDPKVQRAIAVLIDQSTGPTPQITPAKRAAS